MRFSFLPRLVIVTVALLCPVTTYAAGINIFSAPDQYQNGGVNPCIFSGNGQNGCNQVVFPFPAWTESTQQFNPNPLVNEFTPGTEIQQFATNVGKTFFLGFDENQAGSATQTITELTISFRDVNGNPLGSGYTLGGTPVGLNPTAQGEGFTDYVMAAGCAGTIVGSGTSATCSAYAPFVAPAGTRDILFTFGMGTFNDGADRLFLITGGPNGVPTPFDENPAPVPEPATMILMGTGLLAAFRQRHRFQR